MKKERITLKDGKYPNDVREVLVSDYKDVLSVGHSVIIDGKKYIVIDKTDSKVTVLGLDGVVKRIYYKYIDYMFFTVETSRDKDIIEFMKTLNISLYSVVDYKDSEHQFVCKDGSMHSYSFLLTKYLRMHSKDRSVKCFSHI